jgi:hypothetical protein
MRQDNRDALHLIAKELSMSRIIATALVLCALFLGACDQKKVDSSDHLLKEQKRALEKAKEVDRLTREAMERQRKALE